MSKFDILWENISRRDEESFKLTFEEIEKIAGIPIDHSFVTYKKELVSFGYEVKKISMKDKTVEFIKVEGNGLQ